MVTSALSGLQRVPRCYRDNVYSMISGPGDVVTLVSRMMDMLKGATPLLHNRDDCVFKTSEGNKLHIGKLFLTT